MSLRQRGVTTEKLAGFGLLALTVALTAGGVAIRHGIAVGVPRALAASAVPWAITTVAAAGNDSLEEQPGPASRFARTFWADDTTIAVETMTPAVGSALSAEQVSNLRTQLTAAHGELVRIDPAWHEDSVGGFERFRVPLVFERGELDMRVVLDSQNLVAGIFFVEHLDPPTKEEMSAPVDEVEVLVGPPPTGLPGTLSIPPGDGPFPGIVLVHGSGPNDRDETIGPNKPLRDLAWGLAERGVAVLRYDKRSFARPGDLTAVGKSLTVREEVIDDARLALALLRQRDEIDADHVYLLGHSLGGTLAPRIAAAVPRPAGMVILAGATLPLPEKIQAQMTYIAELDGSIDDNERERIESVTSAVTSIRQALDGDAPPPEGAVLGAPFGYYRDLERHDPASEAAELKLPTLVLQGGRDYQVTLEDFARWQSSLADRPGACLFVYDDLDHLFRTGEGPSRPTDYGRPGHVDTRVIDGIADWIRSRACPSGTAPPPPS